MQQRGEYVLGRRATLDGLRGLAVLLVIIDHSRTDQGGSSGTIGVTLFFVLSGFLITRLLLDEHAATGRIDLRAFIGRRARRLMPALGLFLATVAMAFLSAGLPLTPVLFAGTYLTDIVIPLNRDVTLLGHTWSLSLEEQFYVVWPATLMLLLALRRRSVSTLLIGGVISVWVWRAVLVVHGASYNRAAFAPDMRVDALLIGCLLAVHIAHIAHIPRRVLHVAGLVGVAVAAVACVPNLVEASAWGMVPVTLACAVIVGWAATSPVAALTWAPVRGLGRISYGVYLWHYVAACLLLRSGAPGIVVFAGSLVSSVVIGTLSWRLLEQPILRRGRSAQARLARRAGADGEQATDRSAPGLRAPILAAPAGADLTT